MYYITGKRINATERNKELKILKVKDMIELANLKFGYKLLHNLLPKKVSECCRLDSKNNSLMPKHPYETRSKQIPNLPKTMNKSYKQCYLALGPRSILKLSVETRLANSLKSFTTTCKRKIIAEY